MLDLYNFPSEFNAKVSVFNRPSTVLNAQWATWSMSRGTSMVEIVCIGSGAGGGGGFSGVSATARGGGGGGGGGASSRGIFPAFLLPLKLWIIVGSGGAGGAAGAAGSAGLRSYVNVWPDTDTSNVLITSGPSAGSPSAGGAGTGAAGGTGGTGGTIGTFASQPLGGQGVLSFIAGQNGANGGAQTGANGGAIAIPITSILCQGGSGGAGVTSVQFSGGGCTAIANSWLSENRPATPANDGSPGSGGLQLWKPFFSFLGQGGSSADATPGGDGGNGAHGSGGGGGGGGNGGGRGGYGGVGVVIITEW